MAPRRKGKDRDQLQIRPYRPRRQTPTATPAKTKKAASTSETVPAAAPSTSASTSTTTNTTTTLREEEFPVSDANPITIIIEDDPSDSDKNKNGQEGANKNESEEHKKNRGSWTPEKQIVLLQKYAEHFPPGAPWGKSTEAWQKIVDAVNAVAPNDTPLRYDACRRAVDRISERYMEEESIQKAAIAALTKRNKHEGEKADKLIQQESKKERKRMKRLIIQRLAGEKPVPLAIRGVTNAMPGPSLSQPPPPPPTQYIATPVPPPIFNYIQFDQAYVEEQRQYQRSVLQHLENMNEILKDLSQRLQKE